MVNAPFQYQITERTEKQNKKKTPTDTHNTNKQTKEALDASSVNNL